MSLEWETGCIPPPAVGRGKIFVKQSAGYGKLNVDYGKIELDVDFEHDAVCDIKAEICCRKGIATKSHMLVFEGQLLSDDKSLTSCGITDSSTLLMIGRPDGSLIDSGTLPMLSFVSVSNVSLSPSASSEGVEWSKDASLTSLGFPNDSRYLVLARSATLYTPVRYFCFIF